MAQEALLLQAGLQCGAPCVPLSFTLCAKHKHPLAGDDLEFVVLAAAGHLNGGQRDHTLGEGVLERQPNDPQRQKLGQVC